MEEKTRYSLPPLPYGAGELAPHISEEQLSIHHDKHHMAYVNGANANLTALEDARKQGADPNMKAILKDLSWNFGGHYLHSLFWTGLAPAGSGGGGEPKGAVGERIQADFGSFDRFKKEFTLAAASVEGSGWAALTKCPLTHKLQIMQIEKHNTNVFPACPILLVLDLFEHAYYIDYKNDRGAFIQAFWNIVNWDEVNKRF
ncbi:superoxide dismutase [Methanocalculus chunghsingensis]|uniref:Superoxide dismutase n=1 Tax=Methanocalculus chunghsingensis TaxID=156457 RepID=A0A8J7WA74_9EURY|nr:superoxide dismutase [Methanocalculus chunghsingensis]MBR1369465.1 superoxide dismutase [Methanocalculus chunghsingensis]